LLELEAEIFVVGFGSPNQQIYPKGWNSVEQAHPNVSQSQIHKFNLNLKLYF
jgi:hypothetical protein